MHISYDGNVLFGAHILVYVLIAPKLSVDEKLRIKKPSGGNNNTTTATTTIVCDTYGEICPHAHTCALRFFFSPNENIHTLTYRSDIFSPCVVAKISARLHTEKWPGK